jgi:hypothetical protein
MDLGIQTMNDDPVCNGCGHGFSIHNRNVRDGSAMGVDDALLPPKPYDINTDRPAGESGCSVCACAAWKP